MRDRLLRHTHTHFPSFFVVSLSPSPLFPSTKRKERKVSDEENGASKKAHWEWKKRERERERRRVAVRGARGERENHTKDEGRMGCGGKRERRGGGGRRRGWCHSLCWIPPQPLSPLSEDGGGRGGVNSP